MQKEVTSEKIRRIVSTRNVDELKLLDPNARVIDDFGSPILHVCVQNGWVEAVEYLLESNANLSARDNCGGNS